MKYCFILLLSVINILTSCATTAEPEIHLIPKGYKGPVIIIYDQKDGKPKKYEGSFRIYEISKDGVLRTQFEQPKGFISPGKLQYYYFDENGRQQLSYIERTAGAKEDNQPHTFTKEISDGTTRYLVGFLSEGDKYFNQLRKKIDELFPPEVQ